MALVVSVTPPGAIATYVDLVAAVRDHVDDGAYPNTAIDRAIRLAEAHFNRELRTPEMETQAGLNITTELTTMPDDFLSMRSLYEAATPSFPLKAMSPAGLIYTYGQQIGTPLAYALEGRQLRVAPVGTAQLNMDYYARIPILTPDTPQNWLLFRHPDLYLWGTLWYCYQRDASAGQAAAAFQNVSGLIESIAAAGQRNRWGSGPLNPRGIVQVRSARA